GTRGVRHDRADAAAGVPRRREGGKVRQQGGGRPDAGGDPRLSRRRRRKPGWSSDRRRPPISPEEVQCPVRAVGRRENRREKRVFLPLEIEMTPSPHMTRSRNRS